MRDAVGDVSHRIPNRLSHCVSHCGTHCSSHCVLNPTLHPRDFRWRRGNDQGARRADSQIPEPDLYEKLKSSPRWFEVSAKPDVFTVEYPVMPDGDAGSSGTPSHNAEAMVLTPDGSPVILSRRTDGRSRL